MSAPAAVTLLRQGAPDLLILPGSLEVLDADGGYYCVHVPTLAGCPQAASTETRQRWLRSAGCPASQVDGDQAQLAGVVLPVLVGQPAVVRPGEHLGEPDRLVREAGCGSAELAAHDAVRTGLSKSM